ncbi:MAG TPA: LCP family protein [Anaerolineae bacterium]
MRDETEATQPRPAFRPPVARVRPARTPIWLVILSGLLGLMVLFCAALSFTLIAIGPERVLALRDQVLGKTVQQRVESIQQIVDVVIRGEDVWPVPNRGRVTILLMGIDRRPSQGNVPTRTDAITLITLDPQAKTAAMLSIPRDLYVPLAGTERVDRINTAYFYGEANGVPGSGAQAAKDTLALNLGIPVDRYVLIDFDGFRKTIDALGGIDVNVPKRIVDNEYPTDDYRTEVLVIEAGPQHLNGELALKYVRTRHQDSDFGRLQRQQQVILAVRDKALSLGALTQLPALLDAVAGSYESDLTVAEIATVAKVWNDIPRESIAAYRIDDQMAVSWTTPNGASVLIPNRDAIASVVQAFLGQRP